MDATQKAILAARAADQKKAEDITVLDLRGVCTFTDVFLICTGSTRLQLRAISAAVEEGLKTQGMRPAAVDGARHQNWVILDYGDVVVHVMSPEARSFYRLESLWGDGAELSWAVPAAAASSIGA